MAEHSEAPLGVAPPQPDTTWCRCGGCTPTTAATAAGKAAAVAVVVVSAVSWTRGGKSGGCGGVVGGGDSGIGIREDIFGGSPKKFTGKLFRRRQSAGDGGGWPAVADGWERGDHIKELEDELKEKRFELQIAKEESVGLVKKRERGSTCEARTDRGREFDCIRKGLSVGCSDKENLSVLKAIEGFNVYSDTKLYPMYDKLFEKEYSFINKIAKAYRYHMDDLLKVSSEPAPTETSSSLVAPMVFATSKDA
nr:hypothetical protein [Tanacetum cinerariifolium]